MEEDHSTMSSRVGNSSVMLGRTRIQRLMHIVKNNKISPHQKQTVDT